MALLVGFALTGCAAVPIYQGQQAKADDAAARSDLLNAKVAAISIMVTGETPTAAGLAEFGYVQGDGVGPVELVMLGAEDFCLDVLSASGTSFTVTAGSDLTEGKC